MTFSTEYNSPLGPILLKSDGINLTQVNLARDLETSTHEAVEECDLPIFAEALRQLDGYFSGTLTLFDLPLAPRGTVFQKQVWDELRKIPYGTTTSYREIARRIGSPNAMRAVGAANGRNPIAIIVPCHRVIGANGSLVGYAGGLPLKYALLELEHSLCINGQARLKF